MLSGLVNLLFGPASGSQDAVVTGDSVITLTTVAATDNDWLIVDKTVDDSVPAPIEVCPLVDHLDESLIADALLTSCVDPAPLSTSHVVPSYHRRSRPVVPLSMDDPAARCVDPAVARWLSVKGAQECRQRRCLMSRHSFDRSNRATHQRGSQQRRVYNYKLCTHSSQRQLVGSH